MASKTRSRPTVIRRASLTVCSEGKGDFKSLGSALNHIEAGGTIHLLPGRYVLQGKISTSVNIVGHQEKQGDVQLAIPYSQPVLVSDVSLSLFGCDLSCCDTPREWLVSKERGWASPSKSSMIIVKKTGHFAAEYCAWTHSNGPCMEASAGGIICLKNCYFFSCDRVGLRASGGAVVELSKCEFATLWKSPVEFAGSTLLAKECIFARNRDGGPEIQLGTAHFDQCIFEDCLEGAVKVTQKAEVEFLSCQFLGNDVGIKGEGQAKVVARSSKFIGNELGLYVREQCALQLKDCDLESNDRQGLHIKTSRTVDLDHCTLASGNFIGILAEEGHIRLDSCSWPAPEQSTAQPPCSEEGSGWVIDRADIEPEQEGVRVGLKITGAYAHLFAQNCAWEREHSAEICGLGSATFIQCSFQRNERPVSVKDASARFIGCTWSEASLAGLAASGKANVDVSESDFTQCYAGIIGADSAQVTISRSTLSGLQNSAFMAFGHSNTTLQECKIVEIKRTAVEAYHSSSVVLSECIFSNVQMALYGQETASFAAKYCDFRDVFGPSATPTTSRANQEQRVWDHKFSSPALNNLANHINFHFCKFPPTE